MQISDVTEPSESLWDVDIEAFSASMSLAYAWDGFYQRSRGDQGMTVLTAASYERDDGIYAWAIVRATASSAADAERACRELTAEILSTGHAPAAGQAEVRCAARDGLIGDVEALEPGLDDPVSYQPTIHPVGWSTYEPSEDDLTLRINWITGHYPLDRIDVEEAGDRVTVVVHEVHPPLYDPDGTERGILLSGIGQHASIALTAPLADRPVFDGLTGARRPQARSSSTRY